MVKTERTRNRVVDVTMTGSDEVKIAVSAAVRPGTDTDPKFPETKTLKADWSRQVFISVISWPEMSMKVNESREVFTWLKPKNSCTFGSVPNPVERDCGASTVVKAGRSER